MKRRIVLHLGLHKTATGTLQRQFFPACPELNLLTTRVPEMKRFVGYLTRTDPLYFDQGYARALIEEVMDNERPNVMSNESLSGPPYVGVVEGGLDHRMPILQNIRTVFPEAKVLLVLRRQDTLARSLYRQYLKSGGTYSVERFYGLTRLEAPPLFAMDRFRFSPYVDALHNLFPAGVMILTYEEFASKQKQFLARIAGFIGVDAPELNVTKENATILGPVGMEVTRYLNHVFRSRLNPGGMIPGFSIRDGGPRRRISPVQVLHDRWPGGRKRDPGRKMVRVADTIFAAVREDNRILDEKYRLGLSNYGYY